MKKPLSEKILKLRRYLWTPSGMEWGHKDNRGIYVDLGAVVGNIEEAVEELKKKEAIYWECNQCGLIYNSENTPQEKCLRCFTDLFSNSTKRKFIWSYNFDKIFGDFSNHSHSTPETEVKGATQTGSNTMFNYTSNSGEGCEDCKPNRKCNKHHDGFTIEPKKVGCGYYDETWENVDGSVSKCGEDYICSDCSGQEESA